mgnify:CR=1 FL=1
MNTQTIRACWHTHAPLPPLFDWKNTRYIRAIDWYLENLKKESINAVAVTTHDLENLRNPKLKDGDVSFIRNNVNPRTIYRIFERRAKLKDMIVFPAMEVEVYLNPKLKTKIHVGIVHWDENKIYNDFSIYREKTLEELIKVIPKECVVDIKHPWYCKRGISSDKTFKILKRIVDKYNLLVEKNGLACIAYIFMKHIFKLAPYLKKNKFLANKFLEMERSVKLEGFKNYNYTAGPDAHLALPLPKGGGYIELKLKDDSPINKKVIIESIKRGEGKIAVPNKISFFNSAMILLKSFFVLRKEEIILSRILLIKKGLRKKIYWELLKSQPNYKKINKWLSYLNEGYKIKNVLPKYLLKRLEEKKSQNRLTLSLQKFISLVWERKIAVSIATTLFFILRKILTSLVY